MNNPHLPFSLKIGRRKAIPVRDLVDASVCYQLERERSGEGASTFPHGFVFNGETLLAEVSYNGRVWAPGTGGKNWKPGNVPMLEAQ